MVQLLSTNLSVLVCCYSWACRHNSLKQEILAATHPLSPRMLLSGFLYPLLFLLDVLLFSLALVFASVLYDFVSLKTKGKHDKHDFDHLSAIRGFWRPALIKQFICIRITLTLNSSILSFHTLWHICFTVTTNQFKKRLKSVPSLLWHCTFGWTSFSIALAASS